jgi:hypothetical protein
MCIVDVYDCELCVDVSTVPANPVFPAYPAQGPSHSWLFSTFALMKYQCLAGSPSSRILHRLMHLMLDVKTKTTDKQQVGRNGPRPMSHQLLLPSIHAPHVRSLGLDPDPPKTMLRAIASTGKYIQHPLFVYKSPPPRAPIMQGSHRPDSLRLLNKRITITFHTRIDDFQVMSTHVLCLYLNPRRVSGLSSCP